MANNKESFEEKKSIQQEVGFSTSLASTIGQVASVLSGKQSTIHSPSTSEINESKSTGGLPKPEDHHIDFGNLIHKMSGRVIDQNSVQYPSQPQQQRPEIDAIYEAFDGFSFSNDLEMAKREASQLGEVVRIKLAEITASRVVTNTRSMTKSAQKFYTMKGGMRADFSILGQKIAMRAKGRFYGNEFLHVVAEGDSPIGRVMRISPDGSFTNVSKEYNISIEKI